ncbi:hypothetical protein V8G54_024833 [Vigna mungo]|uniref:BED-type domain-containing protein n=1 Tax=Vigna mungo TaxID=3915 RepID=A0AAQ3N7M1_VIGMU
MMTNDQDRSRTSHRSDSDWKHCHPMDESIINITFCNYCGKVMKRGATRAKEHLTVKKGNVAACTKSPKNVREEFWKVYRKEIDSSFLNPGYSVANDNHESEDEVEVSTTSNDKGRNCGGRKGPMDIREEKKKEKLRQANIKGAWDKNLKSPVHRYIALFLYQAGLSFNLVRLKNFLDMIDAIGAYGRNLPTPTCHEIRVPLLSKEVDYTEKLLDHKLQWRKHGCSIMLDAWID